MRKFKIFISDILYVSKKSGTNNKKILILISVLLSNLTALADIAIIVLFSRFITNSSNVGDRFSFIIDLFVDIPVLLPLLIIFRYSFVYFQSYNLKILELRVQKNLKSYLLSEVFDKNNYSIADAYFFINTLTGHIGFFYSALTNFLNFFIQTFAYLIYLIYSDQRTILTFGLGALILFLPSRYLILKSREYMHNSYLLEQQSNKEIQKIIDNMFVIKILKKSKEELVNFSSTLERFNISQIKNHIYGSFNSLLPSFVTLFVFSVLMTVFNLAKTITLDFIGVTLRLFQTLGGIATSTNQIVNSHVHIENFYKLDTNKNTVNKDNHIFDRTDKKLALSINNVKFRYFNSEEYVFQDINLKIQKESHNIIIGENGSGKSTLLGLIAGVLYPEEGKIITYEKSFGYIGPTPLIFTDTLKYNLIYGNSKKIEDKTLIDICNEFQLFKENRENLLDLDIDNKSLSSGQMQKIAFIRAILSEPDILLLDESTSNLDTLSKQKVFEILKSKNVTIVNCTHDPYSFDSVDKYFKIVTENEKRKIIELNGI